jgi:putative transposase
MLSTFLNACKSIFNRIKDKIKQFTKPTTATLAAGTLSDLPRSRADLLAENAMLRQQLIILNHSVNRPN